MRLVLFSAAESVSACATWLYLVLLCPLRKCLKLSCVIATKNYPHAHADSGFLKYPKLPAKALQLEIILVTQRCKHQAGHLVGEADTQAWQYARALMLKLFIAINMVLQKDLSIVHDSNT